MNFLMTPSGGITPNAPMTDEQVKIAAEFIDKLWHIGNFELVLEDNEMLANAPLFTVPKPGQPGQWRVIADMKNGGQNNHICLLYTSPSPRDGLLSRMPSSA